MRPSAAPVRGARLPAARIRRRSGRNDLVRAAPRRLSHDGARAGGRRAGPGSCARREAITLSVETATTPIGAAPEDAAKAHPLTGAAPVKPDSPTFAALGVRPEIVQALSEAGIVHTFAIQELTLPLALAGEDVIGQARTGMGKTLGFGVPLLQRVTPPAEQPAATLEGEAADRSRDVPQALVVVPTRELCVQVAQDLADAGKHLGIRVTAIYGGRAYEPQLAALRKGVDVVVGTPGRLLDLAEQRHLVLGRVKALVLDEADEMLDLGFLPDVERILRMLPEQRHTMLFSATMPGPIIALSRQFLNRPTHIRAEEPDSGSTHENTTQHVYRAHAMDKVELLTRVLQAEGRGLTMIFARTKRTVQRVADDLADRGFAAAAVHGDLGQGAREQALRAFRSGKVDVLVATDVAARGIDVSDVTHVINYQCPEDSKTYVHRIGRTGRAGKTGVAVTLVDWDELHKWKTISDDLGLDKPEAPETYSTSPHLFTDLSIPTTAKGRLPHSQRTRAGLEAEYVDTEGDQGGGRRRDRGRDKVGPRAAEETVLPERKPRRSRSRTRSRAGMTLEGGEAPAASAPATSAPATTAPATTTTPVDAPQASPDAAPGSGPESGPESGPRSDSADGRPRRRRRRGGRGRSGGSEGSADAGSVDGGSEDAAAS
ncbi:DEAD/DEAH box helicase [Pseudonocardia sp. KRD-184]|uniref:RNA helicase n=1 Tax=Pseudonocardia oceani TaxID=2792013 RepID=A0ABS6UC13_9PSEU|nr:DEAD/DEAH box helicase [Pseudonocardia oceani]MBW0095421.1 DEAD/DEAH box helicase [Pseudonocardia oceani]MBW0108096.1 DEAD/DEAH box helicase [Pseudonocardia oceani]MBW0122008.1 DEAD/DEAH box helicase [Pseudonocardia oceani]MBW0129788.1 DEAD/DEAH box helicase [Pseudonocardia oceani]